MNNTWYHILCILFWEVLYHASTVQVIWQLSSFTGGGRPQVPLSTFQARAGTWYHIQQDTYRPYEELIDILVILPGCSLSIHVNRHTISGWYPAPHFRAPLLTRNAVICSGCKMANKIYRIKNLIADF